MPLEPRVKPGTMQGWTRRTGTDDIVSWGKHLEQVEPGPAAYVTVESRVPARVQLAWHRLRLFLLQVLS
jgi:hypothetical protein